MTRWDYDKGQKPEGPEARIKVWKRAHDAGFAGRLCDHRVLDERDAAPLRLVIRSGARRISDFPALAALLAGEEPQKPPRPPMPVTPAELAPLVLLSHGLSDKAAAKMLGKSVETIKKQLGHARRKLGAATTTEACCEALRRGLIE